ncbi:phosphoribosyl-AMP cyclohydrolase [Nitriliruptoraceae bacterium ZYF776]|nr:phosphoribosyl-AMP cyclohydrolase [Profundirhabdus halotolerans]
MGPPRRPDGRRGPRRPPGEARPRPVGSRVPPRSLDARPLRPRIDVPVADLPTDVASLVSFDAQGLVPAVVQQHDTGEVLMVAWMSEVSLAATLETGETVFWSRSRGELWHKGATSGDTQRVVDLRVDCDGDTLLVLVDQRGEGACHTGARTCFGRRLPGAPASGVSAPPAPPLEPERYT